MKRLPILLPILLPVLLLAVLAACSDDATDPNENFLVTVRIVDEAGRPVPDLDLMVLMDAPFYQDGRAAEKAAVRMGWIQPAEALVTVVIEDVAGGLVRELVSQVTPAGQHDVIWNGQDEQGVHQLSGLYWVHMTAFDADTALVYEAREPMYMALMDFDQATVGTTDAAGEIRLRDKRLFPRLYGQVDMHARDENGDDQGLFPLVQLMRFYVRDAVHGGAQRYDREVTHAGQKLDLTWNPVVLPAGQAPAAGAKEASRGAEPPDTGFELRPPYPNPFN